MRLSFVAFTIFCFVLSVSGAARSSIVPQRLAFVVGVDTYDNLGPNAQLKRAVNDAKSVAGALKGLGYRVIQKSDLNRSKFYSLWQSFLNLVKPGDEVLLYYSGHGIEIDGQNYLLPRSTPNVKYGRETQIKRESISLQDLLLDLRERKPRVSLIILDACRDHPLVPPELRGFAPKSGLANMYAPEGTFIMYSAGAGETALDRLPGIDPDNVNSVYTRKLLPLLVTPELSLAEMAVRLRSEVNSLAKTVPHLQRPAYYDGVIGRYCLAGCGFDLNAASKKFKDNLHDDNLLKPDNRKSTIELVKKIQERLTFLGCYQSSIDGVFGPKSRDAWRKATNTNLSRKELTVKELERLDAIQTKVCRPPLSKAKVSTKANLKRNRSTTTTLQTLRKRAKAKANRSTRYENVAPCPNWMTQPGLRCRRSNGQICTVGGFMMNRVMWIKCRR